MSTKLTYTSPINLNGRVIEDICKRVESIKPVEASSPDSPISISYKDDVGAEIKLNMKAYEVQVCVNGESRTLYLYGRP